MVLTFVIIRLTLYFYPNADFDVLGYNIHHLYTGLILIIFAGIPLILYPLKGLISHFATIIFGVGLSLTIDDKEETSIIARFLFIGDIIQ